MRISVEEEDVTRFHHKVGQAVMMVMNQYWPGAQEFTGVRKISSEEEYANTARRLSNEIREKIKEGYKAFNRNILEGIRFTDTTLQALNVSKVSSSVLSRYLSL